MTRPRKIVLAAVAGVAVMVAGVLAALAARPERAHWWTDGESIKVPASDAPLREVLWRPAEPLRAPGAVSTDEYEPRFSADGTVMVFVRNRPGQNADLFTARWSPSGWSEPTPLESVNTDRDELGPELSRDGQSLYFYSDRPGGLGGYDLWESRARDGKWGAPSNLGTHVNSEWNEYGPALSPSGDRLYLSSNRPRPGEPVRYAEGWDATVREHRTRHDYDLYVADRKDGEFKDTRPIDALNTEADEGAPAMSPAGDFLYFASDRPSGLGGFDLWRARVRRSGTVGPAEALGNSVNSAANDLDPALSADGFRLTFSSDRPLVALQGEGGSAGVGSSERPGRYLLWTTSSREVYREFEERQGLASGIWPTVWPWLLLLLALAPLYLLYRLLRDQTWRQRFARLSLLAQCLLISLFIHAGIASGLTVWKVGAGIVEGMSSSGGTRVVLTSGAPGGVIAGQLRGGSAGEAAVLPEFEGLVMPVAMPSNESVATPVELPRMAEALVPPVNLPVAEVGARSEAIPVDATPQRYVGGVAEVPTVAPPPAQSEFRMQPVPDVNVQGAIPTGVATPTTRLVESALPTLADRRSVGAVLPRAPETSTSKIDRLTGLQATLSDSAVASPSPLVTAPIPAVAARQPALSEPGRGSQVGAGSDQILTPAVVTEGSGDRFVEIEPSPLGVAAATRSAHEPSGPRFEASAGRGEHAAGAALSAMANAPPASNRVTDAQVRLPAVGRGPNQPAGEPGMPRSNVVEPGFAPPPIALESGARGGGKAVQIDPVRNATGYGDRSGVPAGMGHVAADREPSQGAFSDNAHRLSGATPEPISGVQIPLGIPTPVETFAQRDPESRGELVEKMGGSSETERAVGLALDWFIRHQSVEGYWSADHFDDACGQCNGAAEVKADAAMTGMVLLCYLGAGHTHQKDGPYREAIDKGLRWLIKRQTADGDLRRGETMYGQTAAAVALCEAFAMTRDPQLAEPARKAVEFVLVRAATQGRSSDRDTSVLGWLVFTVESARRAGFEVPQTTFDAAKQWLDYVGISGTPGRYAYSRGGPASAAMTAEAMFVRQLLGHTRDEAMMQQSARFVLESPPKWQEGAPTFYWYYATLALFQHQGDSWKQWNEQLVAELLTHQEREGRASGSWAPTDQWSRMGGRVYQTAVCTLSLEVYYRYKAR